MNLMPRVFQGALGYLGVSWWSLGIRAEPGHHRNKYRQNGA